MSNFSVSTVPVDALVPIGARASAGTVMTKFKSHIYMGPALQGLKCWKIPAIVFGPQCVNII